MRIITAITTAFVLTAIGIFVAMPVLSKSGILGGREIYGLFAILSAVSYFVVARGAVSSKTFLAIQAFVVGISAPWATAFAGFLFCWKFLDVSCK